MIKKIYGALLNFVRKRNLKTTNKRMLLNPIKSLYRLCKKCLLIKKIPEIMINPS